MSRFLVTGGTGQIGSYVCRELVHRGYFVAAFDELPNMENISEISGSVTLVKGDIANASELNAAVKAHRITHIVHLAALLLLESRGRPCRATEVNCLGTNHVFEAARLFDLEGVAYASSEVVYGPPTSYAQPQVDEETAPACPPEPYHLSKLFTEGMGAFYRRAYGLNIVCLRLTGAWGPGRYTGYTGQFNAFIRDVALGRASRYPEDFAYRGAKLRYLYVKDAARAFVHAVLSAKELRMPLYNVGSKKAYNCLDVMRALKEVVPDARVELQVLERPTQTSLTTPGPAGLDVNCSKFFEEAGFEQEFDLERALRDMVYYERAKGRSAPQPG